MQGLFFPYGNVIVLKSMYNLFYLVPYKFHILNLDISVLNTTFYSITFRPM